MVKKIKVVDVNEPELQQVEQAESVEAVVEEVKDEPINEIISDIKPGVEAPVKEVDADIKPDTDLKEVKKSVKTTVLVECPKCFKKLTERTLKYSHEDKCPKNENRKKKEVEEVNKVVKDTTSYIKNVDKETPKVISAYEQRLLKIKEKQEKYKILASQAF